MPDRYNDRINAQRAIVVFGMELIMVVSVKSEIRFIIRLSAGCVSALLVCALLLSFYETVGSIDATWKTVLGRWLISLGDFSLTLIYGFIFLVGLPTGTASGIILVNKTVLKEASNKFAVAIGILVSEIGLILVIWGLPAIGINIFRMPQINHNFIVIPSLLSLTAGLFGVIGYDIGCDIVIFQKAQRQNLPHLGNP